MAEIVNLRLARKAKARAAAKAEAAASAAMHGRTKGQTAAERAAAAAAARHLDGHRMDTGGKTGVGTDAIRAPDADPTHPARPEPGPA